MCRPADLSGNLDLPGISHLPRADHLQWWSDMRRFSLVCGHSDLCPRGNLLEDADLPRLDHMPGQPDVLLVNLRWSRDVLLRDMCGNADVRSV